MFECDRCGSSYSSQHIGVEHCPRCRLRDKVDSPLAFRAFTLGQGGEDEIELTREPETTAAAEQAA